MRQKRDDRIGRKISGIMTGTVLLAGLVAGAIYLVDVDQTKEARLPTINLTVENGQMPEFDVEIASIKLGETEVKVDVPTVDVETETKTIEVEMPVEIDAGTTTETVGVPTLRVDTPEQDDPAGNPSQ